ncbi:MAG: Thermophilic serine proteinase precursor [Deltaproteobacteria bacterium ADurb.BinA179]|jgi:subtilisin family serine protease|nr:MAG: Thermophilic serine proteinase precursor [Deltaproteobacteria bacterium ADurb.BinA179]HOD70986.1 S8 family peptidase [Deltaproteobacteria bacterium]
MKYAATISGVFFLVLASLSVSGAEYTQDEIIVKFKAPEGMAHAMAAGGGIRPVTIAVDDARQAIDEMLGRDDVEYIEPNYVIEAEIIPNDWPYDPAIWSGVDFPGAWDLIEADGSGIPVTIAVIDSGVDAAHPDLAGILTTGRDFVNNDAIPEDDAGHGTRVCGIIAALGNNGFGVAGAAWNVDIEIMPLKFMKVNDGKTTGNLADAVNAIYHAVDNGADMINASWGFYSYSHSLADAIRYAESRGVMFVCSAGNKGQDNDVNDHYPSNYPFENVIAVAAMNSVGEIASFSNYGLETVDIAAPGVGIRTTDTGGGYTSWASGTSFAAPFVTAVAAMVKSLSPAISPAGMRNVLLNSATIEDGSGFEYIASGGSINAYQALLAEAESDASSKAAASGPDMDGQAVASSEGGGGGGCLIESGRNPGSALALATLFSLMVLSRVSLLRHQG